MYAAGFQLDSFEYLPEIAQCALMRTLTDALAGVNEAFLMNNGVPRLYMSGVRYAPPTGNGVGQNWRDIPRILAQGKGATCMELAAWRIAELKLKEGVRTTPLVTCKWLNGARGLGLMFHVRIQDARGRVEDPSAELGMGENEWFPFY